MSKIDWMNHPDLKHIDKAKLEIILALADESGNKKQNELVPFLLATAARSKKEGFAFTAEEIDTVIEVLKEGKPPEEIQRMNKIRNMMKMMK